MSALGDKYSRSAVMGKVGPCLPSQGLARGRDGWNAVDFREVGVSTIQKAHVQ